MGTELAVSTTGARPVMSIDISKLNYGGAKAAIDKYINAVGGSSGGGSKFPGQQITYKQAEWTVGFGDRAKAVKIGTKLVFNVPNLMAGWVKWEENASGKKRPTYTDMCFPAAGDEAIQRESLGDLDAAEWDTDDKGVPLDPWRPILVYPVRDNSADATINHVQFSTKSSCIAGFNLFRDIIEDMKLRPGQLPIVELGTDKAKLDRKVTDKKTGKEKTEKLSWDIPVLKVVGWVEATEIDNPGPGGVAVLDDSAEPDLGNVTAQTRTPKEEPKQVAKKPAGKVRRVVPDEDDDTI